MTVPLLELSGVSKRYGGVQALDDVCLRVAAGGVACLAGENGSGKSTLIKILAGTVAPDHGTIAIDGEPQRHLTPLGAIRSGIQVIYQDFALFPNLSVAENIAFTGLLAAGRRRVRWGALREQAGQACAQLGVALDLDAPVERLPVAQKQLVAIARALAQQARLLVLDEATTALTGREIGALFAVVRGLRAQGIATLFVSHKLDEVDALAEQLTVLRNGRVVLDAPAAGVSRTELVNAMTGRALEADSSYTPPAPSGAPLLRVRDLTRPGALERVSFDLWPGEILGVTGLLGAGRTELALALFGLAPATAGSIAIDGAFWQIRNVQDALSAGIGYVPEDRLSEGLFLERSIGENAAVRVVDRLAGRLGRLDPARLAAVIAHWVRELAIKTPSAALAVRTLSGGNQQRVVLARWLADEPRVLILNGPTVGVDVGAKHELHGVITGLAQRGMGILVISDDLPEVLTLCNRVMVLRHGAVAATYDRAALTADTLAAALAAPE